MSTNKVVTITPALSKDVLFTDKVKSVDQALKDRTAAQANIKKQWAELVKVLAKAGHNIPQMRYTESQAANMVNNVVVYVKTPEIDMSDEMKQLAVTSPGYYIIDLYNMKSPVVAEKFPEFWEFAGQLSAYNKTRNTPKQVDQKATEAAKAKVLIVVNKYIAALQKYQDTVDAVANVREYISIVKDVASIAGASGGK